MRLTRLHGLAAFRQFRAHAVELAHLLQERLLVVGADRQGETRRADIRRELEHLRKGQHAVLGVIVVDGVASDMQRLLARNRGVQRELAGIQRHGEGKRLEGGAHFEHAAGEAIQILVLLRVAGIIGVVIGQRCGGDDFAGVDVEDGGGGGLGVEAVHRQGQFVAHGMGGAHVDRQRDRPQVLLRHGEAGGAQGAEPLVVQIFFDALQAVVVGVGEADDMGAEPSVGIDALVLRQKADAGQAEAKDLVSAAPGSPRA